jgi:positive regulator of sigma E activity
MGFNGKSLILIGSILFIFQIANFFSIEIITPELERAQVLAAIASLIIILIGFLFKQFEPLAGEKANLKGENKFIFDKTFQMKLLMNLHGDLKRY